ncbi:BadF/BadG/BcrA/BcrD ATPase family protein [uncultured Alteromonas sp.]|jgi:glucosamine kinase|uniref:BadF/BadG/BcrA/BcrD ATPase family protein n=1 Tax=uncultured Alteromonas sp. TaxID=179113 RepID=UPI0025D46D41|nr:BadF/BadG/BcrA/BcrD ATPase family protein [uncultured Alteromonas sp.]
MKSNTYFIGVDGGGSRCRVRLEDQHGKVLSTASSGPANIMRNPDVAEASIRQAAEQAIKQTGLSITAEQVVLCAGLAGANIAGASQAFLKRELPFMRVHLVSDLHAACAGAHRGNAGAVIVCGTGSSATRYANHTFTDFGGHGFPIGDKASGAWLGLQAIQHTLLGYDHLAPRDAVFDAVSAHFNSEQAEDIVQQCSGFNSNDYAAIVTSLMPLYQNGDSVVAGFIEQGRHYLQCLAEQAIGNSEFELCLIGGLTAVYQPLLSDAIQQRIQPCAHSPEQGAILLAKQAVTSGEG